MRPIANSPSPAFRWTIRHGAVQHRRQTKDTPNDRGRPSPGPRASCPRRRNHVPRHRPGPHPCRCRRPPGRHAGARAAARPPPRRRCRPIPLDAAAGCGGLCGGCDAARHPLPRHHAPGRQHLRRARGGRLPAGAVLRLGHGGGWPHPAAALQLRPGPHPPPRRRRAARPQAAALRHHRPARRPRRRHRRLQVGQPGRRGAAPRPPGLFRDLLPRSGAGPDHPRHHPRRGRLPRAHPRAAPRGAEAGGHRQLPGRLGGDDARRLAARAHRRHRAERRAAVLLGGRARPEPDALPRRPRRRVLAGGADGRPRQRQVRRRQPGAELREPVAGAIPGSRSTTTCLPTWTRRRRASSNSRSGGAATS